MSDLAQQHGDRPVTSAYLPGVRGHVVLAHGPDADGRPALAAWQLNAAGGQVGSWEIALSDGAPRLLPVLSKFAGYVLVDWTVSQPAAILAAVADLLPADSLSAGPFSAGPFSAGPFSAGLVDRLSGSAAALTGMLAEIREERSRYEGLPWPSRVPSDDDAPVALTRRRPVNSPVAAAALGMASAVRNAIALWDDTERCRLRAFGGEPRPLPPDWLAFLRTAAGPF